MFDCNVVYTITREYKYWFLTDLWCRNCNKSNFDDTIVDKHGDTILEACVLCDSIFYNIYKPHGMHEYKHVAWFVMTLIVKASVWNCIFDGCVLMLERRWVLLVAKKFLDCIQCDVMAKTSKEHLCLHGWIHQIQPTMNSLCDKHIPFITKYPSSMQS